jgi:hypothetical protein
MTMKGLRCYNCNRLLDDPVNVTITEGEPPRINVCVECSTRPYFAERPINIFTRKYHLATLSVTPNDEHDPLHSVATLTLVTNTGDDSRYILCYTILEGMFRFNPPVRENGIGMHKLMGAMAFNDDNDEYIGYVNNRDVLNLIANGGTVELFM